MSDEQHPDKLPWYVAGLTSEAESAEINQHMVGCSACREQVRALESMHRSIDRADRELFGIDLQQSAGTPLETVTPAATAKAAVAQPAPRRPRQRFYAAAVAGLLIVWVGGMLLRGTVTGEPTLRVAQGNVQLMPTVRSIDGPPTLPAIGVWGFEVVLPTAAPDGSYTIELEQIGIAQIIARQQATADEQGRLFFQAEVEKPGDYQLRLVSAVSSSTYRYPFSVEHGK